MYQGVSSGQIPLRFLASADSNVWSIWARHGILWPTVDAEPSPPAELPFEVEVAYRRRLEAIVFRLLRMRFRSVRPIWKLQVDLLNLQGEIQASISKRSAQPSTLETHKEIEALRDVRWHARRFGDALAWALFQGERQSIYPLAENATVPIVPAGAKSQSLVAACEMLSTRMGFPLMHDVTDVLRIGDVTFFQPPEPPRTVELKSKEIGRQEEGDGVRLTYSMMATWPADGRERAPESPLAPAPMPKSTRPSTNSKRFHRQLARMTKAHGLRNAELGKPLDIDGHKQLMIPSPIDDAPGHWSLLRQLIRRARRSGYASGSADRATFYVVMYNKAGFHAKEDLVAERFLPDLVGSDLWFADASKNSIVVSSLPDARGKGPSRYLPYYLYPIPRTSIADILHGRLVILAVLNVGRLNAALEAAGFTVEDNPKHWMPLVFMPTEIDGARYRVQFGNLHENIQEVIQEARPLSSMVAVFEAVAGGAAEQAPDLIREHQRR